MAVFVVTTSYAVLWIGRDRSANAQSALGGTSAIRGRVLAIDTDEPLGSLRVVLAPVDAGVAPRETTTDADGRYEFPGLPAGRYTVSAGGGGYLTQAYGQRRPLEPGQPRSVVDHAAAEGIDFRLTPMSGIGGRVTDQAGESIPNAKVFVLRPIYVAGQRRLTPVASTATDDSGRYRVANLASNGYYVCAMVREVRPTFDDGIEQNVGYASRCLSSTASATEARRLTVGVGEQIASADISLTRGRTATVSGTAVDSLGRPLLGQTVYLIEEIPVTASMAWGSEGALIARNGTFSVRNVPPGEHKLVVRYVVDEGGTNHLQEVGVVRVAVKGSDLHRQSCGHAKRRTCVRT
jgi:hypothetical protein